MKFKINIPDLNDTTEIPIQYTCDGENISPEIRWENAPQGTQSFVVIIDRLDKENDKWNHWLIYNIPKDIFCLKKNIKTLPAPAKRGENSWKVKDYRGPCPAEGCREYNFKVYALDNSLILKNRATRASIEKAMKNHILAKAEITKKYTRLLPHLQKNTAKADIEDALTVINRKDVSEDIKEKAYREIEKDALGKQ